MCVCRSMSSCAHVCRVCAQRIVRGCIHLCTLCRHVSMDVHRMGVGA